MPCITCADRAVSTRFGKFGACPNCIRGSVIGSLGCCAVAGYAYYAWHNIIVVAFAALRPSFSLLHQPFTKFRRTLPSRLNLPRAPSLHPNIV